VTLMFPLRQAIVRSLCVLAFAGVSHVASAQTTTVLARDGWVREPVPSRDVTALFVVLENHGASPRAVVAGTSDAVDRVELHEMKMDGGMMRMSPVKQIDVPAGGQTELKPGGLHVMLFGLKKRFSAGESLTVTLMLDDGTKIPVTAIVRAQETKQ
jgi:copper(I)-binding protein